MKKLLYALLPAILLFATPSYGQEAKTLSKGQPAPFDGTLLSPEASAKILADKRECERRVVYEAEYAAKKAAIDTAYTKDLLIASIQRDLDLEKLRVKDREAEVAKLEKDKSKNWVTYVIVAVAGAATGFLVGGTIVLVSK